jgi:hypothetical protein
MSRKRGGASAAAAAEGEPSGTFADVLTARPKADSPAAPNWGAPRPEEKRRTPRASAPSKLKVVTPAEPGDDSARLYDRATVDSIYDALDFIVPSLHQNDQSTYVHLFRRTVGAGKRTCIISLAELGRLAGVSVSGATYSVRRLENNSPQLIKRTGKKFGRGQSQGVEIEVFWPVI